MKTLEQVAKEIADIANDGRPIYGTVLGALVDLQRENDSMLDARDKTIEELTNETQHLNEQLTDAMEQLSKAQAEIKSRDDRDFNRSSESSWNSTR